MLPAWRLSEQTSHIQNTNDGSILASPPIEGVPKFSLYSGMISTADIAPGFAST